MIESVVMNVQWSHYKASVQVLWMYYKPGFKESLTHIFSPVQTAAARHITEAKQCLLFNTHNLSLTDETDIRSVIHKATITSQIVYQNTVKPFSRKQNKNTPTKLKGQRCHNHTVLTQW